MKEQLEEILTTIKEHLPEDFSVYAFIEDPEFAKFEDDPQRIENLAYCIGFLRGAAAYVDVPVLELLDNFSIELEEPTEEEG